jgi:hypothetical protein
MARATWYFCAGNPPDWSGRSFTDFGYILRRAAILDGEYVPCRLDDPQRTGWAIFSIGDDGSLKQELFGNDLLTMISTLEGPFDE